MNYADLSKAKCVASSMLSLSRQLYDQDETPQALRDLSVSLNKVGDVDKQRGLVDKAAEAFAESLDISRQLLEFGQTPQALRDLAISHERLGDLALKLNDVESAKQNAKHIKDCLEKLII